MTPEAQEALTPHVMDAATTIRGLTDEELAANLESYRRLAGGENSFVAAFYCAGIIALCTQEQARRQG